MDITAALPEPVQWFEGMLLGPQHMQQQHIYWQHQLRHQMAQLQPYYWGLVDLEIDEARLRQGEVRITRVQAVMPDGLVVQFPARGQEEVLAIDLKERAEWKEQRPVKVYLAVPASMGDAVSERYFGVAGGLEVDLNTGEGHLAVPRLRARPALLPADRLAPKFTAIPLLEVQRDLGGNFTLTEFHPPLLRAQAASFLGGKALHRVVQTLTSRVRDKVRELAGARVDGHGAPGSAVVRPLAAALPPLEVMARGGASHPFDLYLALSHLVGNLAAIGNDPVPLLMEPYRHDDAMPGFAQAIRHVVGVLAQLRAGYESLPFEHSGGTFHRVVPEGTTERMVIELRAQPGQTREALASWAKQAVIGVEAVLPALRRRRVPGAGRRLLRPEEMAEIDLQGNGLLLEVTNRSVEVDGKEVAVIQSGQMLHLDGSEAGAPAAVICYRETRGVATPGGPGRG